MADRIAELLVAEHDAALNQSAGVPPYEQVLMRVARRRRRSATLIALGAVAVVVTGLLAVPRLSGAAPESLLPAAPPTAGAAAEPSPAEDASGEQWVSQFPSSARVCRNRFGRCVVLADESSLHDLASRFNAAGRAPIGCGGGDPDLVVLLFSYPDDHQERVSVNLDCDHGTASVQGKKGRALDDELRAAILAVAPSDYGDPATLAEAFGPAATYPGRPWAKGGLDVPAVELAAAAGPMHCSWQGATVISGTFLARRQFIRDPHGVLGFAPELKAGFRAGGPLPSDAARTGYTSGRFALWLAPSDPDAVWLSNSSDEGDTERWPSADKQIGCA